MIEKQLNLMTEKDNNWFAKEMSARPGDYNSDTLTLRLPYVYPTFTLRLPYVYPTPYY